MRALLVPEVGDFVVLNHKVWDVDAILQVLDTGDVDSYEWPYPPGGRNYSVYHRASEEPWTRGASLITRRPSLVLAHNHLRWQTLSRSDLHYFAAIVAMEQVLTALPSAQPKEIT